MSSLWSPGYQTQGFLHVSKHTLPTEPQYPPIYPFLSFFLERAPLHSLGWPGTVPLVLLPLSGITAMPHHALHYMGPASSSQVLASQICTARLGPHCLLKHQGHQSQGQAEELWKLKRIDS